MESKIVGLVHSVLKALIVGDIGILIHPKMEEFKTVQFVHVQKSFNKSNTIALLPFPCNSLLYLS